MPCPIQTQHIKTETDCQTVFKGKKQNSDFFSREQTLDMHDSAQFFCYLLGPLCSMMLKGLDFAYTQTNEEGLHKNFHKLDSTHLAK